jgi:hypothetical protein
MSVHLFFYLNVGCYIVHRILCHWSVNFLIRFTNKYLTSCVQVLQQVRMSHIS